MVDDVRRHLESAIASSKCHSCGCFHDAITALGAGNNGNALQPLLAVADAVRLERQQDRLGCETCWSTAAVDAILPAPDGRNESTHCEPRASDPAHAFVIRIDRDAKQLVANARGEEVRGATAVEVTAELVRRATLTRMEDAAYLGRELTRAEAALHGGESYVQDHSPARGPMR